MPREFDLAPEAMHPHAGLLEADLASWVRRAGLPEDQVLRDGVARLTAGVLPSARTERLVALARWFAVLFWLDDRSDHDQADPEEVGRTSRSLLAAMTGSAAAGPLATAVGEEWRDVSEPMSQEWKARALKAFAWHGEALAAEARRRRLMPTRASYGDLRPWTNGVFLYHLMEPLHDVQLPHEFAESLLWHLIVHTASDITAWRNDIASAEREAGSGDLENLVLIAMRTESLTLDQAVRRIDDEISARCEDYVGHERSALEQARTWCAPERAALRLVLNGIRSALAGHARWLSGSGRHTAVPPGDRRHPHGVRGVDVAH
ncbi:hypothetical protein [Nocardia sp. NRRL S-836]|uniref:terpene synthase family protein n=1 Tax=Nocardia sp. NRRL S-836 TaxID=1519492 RepID=UPI0006AF20CE|nr:hypothetical protein [Nocardia sp. NRRL S-836]KOV86342.1 hypothetical protein ADL03_09435 [Nocardia sp. NRRL S-836]